MAHDKVYGVCENKCFVEIHPNNYSNEDQIIGKWIDGKNLKRRIIENVNFIEYSETHWGVSYSDVITDDINVKSIRFNFVYDFNDSSLQQSRHVLGTCDCTDEILAGRGGSSHTIVTTVIPYGTGANLRGTLIVEYTDQD